LVSSTIESLYRNSHRQLLGYVRSRVSDPDDAEDLVQGLYVKLYRALERGTPIERPEAFLFRSARNAVVDYYRTRKPHAHLPDDADTADIPDRAVTGTSDEEELTAEIRLRMTGWMQPLIEELEEPYRTTLRMSELQELPYREIAERLGIGLSAVKSRVRRGRERMRKALLACCRFAFDAAGRVVDYERRDSCSC
jgi:RNA polymerase sigma-70 factor (ECF subfamily)